MLHGEQGVSVSRSKYTRAKVDYNFCQYDVHQLTDYVNLV